MFILIWPNSVPAVFSNTKFWLFFNCNAVPLVASNLPNEPVPVFALILLALILPLALMLPEAVTWAFNIILEPDILVIFGDLPKTVPLSVYIAFVPWIW